MKYRPLGKTGLQVSEVGFGAWPIGGNQFGNSYGPTDDTVSLAALNQAYELGCTFFDTSDNYGRGHSEALIGQALKGWYRDEVVIATKGGIDWSGEAERPNFSERHLRQSVEASLKRLGVEAIDLYQLHNPSRELIELARMFEVLKTLQAEGKVRFYGISIHDPVEGIRSIELGGVQAIQEVYNLFDCRCEKALLAACEQQQVGFIVREPLANGFLTSQLKVDTTFSPGDMRLNWPKLYLSKRLQAAEQFKKVLPERYQSLSMLALQFVLAQSAVSVVIPGCKTPEQVQENMTASELPALTSEELLAVQAVAQSLT